MKKTLLALTLATGSLMTFAACESDDVSPTVQTTTTTEETLVQQPAATSTTTVRSY